VFVVQPTCNPNPNDYIMELVIMLDAFRRAGALRVTAVVPIFGYARQDKKDASRAPITAKVVADMLHNAGADRVIAVDLHAPQIQGFVNFPLDNLYGLPLMVKYIRENIMKGTDPDDVVVVSPDVGGAKRADNVASSLGSGFAIFSKKRKKAGEIDRMILVGDVANKKCVLIDDMCDTGGSLTQAADQLLKEGAKEVHAAVVHGVFSRDALDKITKSPIKEMIVTDTIPMDVASQKCSKLRVLSVAPLLAESISRIHKGDSLSELFPATSYSLLKEPKKNGHSQAAQQAQQAQNAAQQALNAAKPAEKPAEVKKG
jgi:ribose-phosphate pyrophosphokinase